ncbi:MAG: hypothetical protein JWN91_1166 [Nocardioides sp.]|nr:hypothetical protein [Nocardioides sp.]
MDLVDACAVGSAERGGFFDGVIGAQPDGAGDGGLNDLGDGPIQLLARDSGPACMAQCLGAEVPDVPRCSGFLDSVDGRGGGVLDPFPCERYSGVAPPDRTCVHLFDLGRVAHDVVSLGPPCRPLVELTAGVMLGVAGLECRLIAE